MRRRFLLTLLMCTTMALASSRAAGAAPPDAAASGSTARGEYLVNLGGCHHCHTPLKMGPKGPEPDMSRMLSGHPAAMVLPPAPKMSSPWTWASVATNTAFAGPWGLSYAINLTPDATGLGNWTE